MTAQSVLVCVPRCVNGTHDRAAVCVDLKWSVAPIVPRGPEAEFFEPPEAYLVPGHLAAPWVESAHVSAAERVLATGFWTSDRDSIAWPFEIDKPGRFDVIATIATPAASSRFEIAVGDGEFAASVTNTGSYQSFETVKLGTVRIKQGPCELSIKPIRNQWQPINLRSVVLKPAGR